MSLSKPDSDNVFQKVLKAYIQMLQHRPIFTKSCTRFVKLHFLT